MVLQIWWYIQTMQPRIFWNEIVHGRWSFYDYVQPTKVGRLNTLSNAKTSCDLSFGRKRYWQILQHGCMRRCCHHYFGMNLCIENEAFRIYVQITKVGGLNTLSSAKKPHVIWALDEEDIDKFNNMGKNYG